MSDSTEVKEGGSSYVRTYSMGKAIVSCFSKYACFKGRARRSEFWYFCLFNVLVIIVPLVFTCTALFNPSVIQSAFSKGLFDFCKWFVPVYYLLTFLPSLGVAFRRLHDKGKSGAWVGLTYVVVLLEMILQKLLSPMNLIVQILSLIIVAWSILLLVWYCMPGKIGPNKYGEDPKNVLIEGDIEEK